MFKKLLFWVILAAFSGLHAQEINTLYKTKKIPVSRDTIRIEKNSINSSFFKLLDAKANTIDTSFYKINFQKGTLLLNQKLPLNLDSLTVQYL